MFTETFKTVVREKVLDWLSVPPEKHPTKFPFPENTIIQTIVASISSAAVIRFGSFLTKSQGKVAGFTSKAHHLAFAGSCPPMYSHLPIHPPFSVAFASDRNSSICLSSSIIFGTACCPPTNGAEAERTFVASHDPTDEAAAEPTLELQVGF